MCAMNIKYIPRSLKKMMFLKKAVYTCTQVAIKHSYLKIILNE